ncbi:MAG: alpha/beta fold hydrolase [Alphaproteobacteria bacterium]
MDVVARGIRFNVELAGPEGAPWLTFCNSLNTSLPLWDDQIPAFADRYRTLRYDRRGHGKSATPPGPYALEDFADDIVAIWDALGIRKSHFVGLSIGGMTGQALALKHPERVNGLVLACTRAETDETFRAFAHKQISIAETDGPRALSEIMPARWFTPDAQRDRPEVIARAKELTRATTRDGYIACARAMLPLDYLERLRDVKLPTLLIAAAQDIGTPAAGMREMHKRMPHAEYVEIDPSGHLVNMQQPAAFNRALAAFLDRLPR